MRFWLRKFGWALGVLLLALSISLSALARDFQLFTAAGYPVKDYNSLIAQAQPGDRFVFSNGRVMEVRGFLGQGFTTKIFDVTVEGKPFALRLPQSAIYTGAPPSELSDVSFIDETLEGYKTLSQEGVPLVKVHEGLKGQYALVEKVEKAFTLKQFLFRPDNIPHEQLFLARQQLKDFVEKTAHLTFIGDFHEEQLIFDAKTNQWLLLDWTNQVGKYVPTGFMGAHLFDENKQYVYKIRYGASAWTEAIFKELDGVVGGIRMPSSRGMQQGCASLYQAIAETD